MADPIFYIDTPTPDPTYATATGSLLLGGVVQETTYPIAEVRYMNATLDPDTTFPANVSGGRWSGIVSLAPGDNNISAWAVDTQGNITGDPLVITYTPGLPIVQYATQSYVWTFNQLGTVTPTEWHFKWGTSPGNHPTVVTYPAAQFSARLNAVLPGPGTYYAVVCASDGSVEWAISPEYGAQVVGGAPAGVLLLRVE